MRLAVRGRQGAFREYEDAGSPERANSECEAVSEPRALARDVPGATPGG